MCQQHILVTPVNFHINQCRGWHERLIKSNFCEISAMADIARFDKHPVGGANDRFEVLMKLGLSKFTQFTSTLLNHSPVKLRHISRWC